MDDNDDDYSGAGNRQERQGYSQYNPPHNALTIQAAMELEQEIYLRQQLEMQRDMHVRRRLLQEQQHHLLSEIDHNLQFQHMQRHHDISSPLVHQQRMFDLPYGSSAAHHQLRLHEEQAYLEEQRHRMLQQHQHHQQARANMGLTSTEGSSHLTDEARKSLIRSQLTGNRSQSPTSRPERPLNYGTSDSLRDSTVMDHKATESKPASAVAESAPTKRKRQRKKSIDKSEKGSKRSAPDKSKTAVAEVTSNCSLSPSDQDKTKGLLDALNHIEEKDQSNFDIHVKIASQILIDSKESASGETEFGGRENGNSMETFEAETMDISDQKTAEEREVGAIMGSLHGQDLAPNQSSKKSEETSSTQREVATLIANLQKADVSVDPFSQDRKSSVGKKSNASDMITGIVMPGFTSILPQLPVEPEFCEEDIVIQHDICQEALNGTESDTILANRENSSSNGVNSRPGNLPLITAPNRDSTTSAKAKSGSSKQQLEYTTPIDTWWPSNNTIKRERRIRGERAGDDISDTESTNLQDTEECTSSVPPGTRERLRHDIEPGILEKLPHCKIHRMHKQGKNASGSDLLFCWQVSENYCNDVMVCCSICSTWRHAFCGGHHKNFTIQGMLNSSSAFTAVCDRCHEENTLLRDYPKAHSRIERQRIEHLRRTLATSAVIRQASFAKHGGTYKWPLGSVSATHIGGHTRSVHARHERSEKQWTEMAVKLGNGLGYRPKERVKVRTRELERLLVSVEDAEGITDRHNIMLFLRGDTSKQHPAGFEVPRKNFFDPDEDFSDDENDENEGKEKIEEGTPKEAIMNSTETDQSGEIAHASEREPNKEEDGMHSRYLSESEKYGDLPTETSGPNNIEESIDNGGSAAADTDEHATDDSLSGAKTDFESKAESRNSSKSGCARQGCKRKPRFDSIFCSDSCGVAAIEVDLLHSFEYANDIHPALLRS